MLPNLQLVREIFLGPEVNRVQGETNIMIEEKCLYYVVTANNDKFKIKQFYLLAAVIIEKLLETE